MDYLNLPADRSGYVKINEGELFYRRTGPGKGTPLLAVHGGPGFPHEYLLPLLELAGDREVIFYDQLDTGNSKGRGNPRDWTLEHFTGEIDALRKALGLDEVHILASSWGCSIAVNYAAGKPRGLKSLTLCGALVNTKRWIDDNNKYREQLPPGIRAALDKYEAARDYTNPEYVKAVDVFYHRHLCRAGVWPDYLLQAFARFNTDLYNYMWGPTEFLCNGTLKNLDLVPKLPLIDAPALFISGEFDEGTPAASAEYAAHMKKAEQAVIKDASHCPHIEKTDEFIRIVRDFTRKTDA